MQASAADENEGTVTEAGTASPERRSANLTGVDLNTADPQDGWEGAGTPLTVTPAVDGKTQDASTAALLNDDAEATAAYLASAHVRIHTCPIPTAVSPDEVVMRQRGRFSFFLHYMTTSQCAPSVHIADKQASCQFGR